MEKDSEFLSRYRKLQNIYIKQRDELRLHNSDIAGILGIDSSTVSEAESSTSPYPFPRHYLSDRVASAYCQGRKDLVPNLIKHSFSAFYPEGIHTLKGLVMYVAYLHDSSVESLGRDLSIDHFNKKISCNQNSALSLREVMKLRGWLSEKMRPIQFLPLDISPLDTLLPDPLVAIDDPRTCFKETFKLWVGICAESAEAFSALVTEQSGKNYSKSMTSSSWANGIGLVETLSSIIETLKKAPATKDIFTAERESALRAKAKEAMPKTRVKNTMPANSGELVMERIASFSSGK